jgi:hypothetical protein
MDADADGTLRDNEVTYVTAYGNQVGIYVAGGYTQIAGECVDNRIVKSIASGNSTAQLQARWGGQNDGFSGYGNAYLNDSFGADQPAFASWGSQNIGSRSVLVANGHGAVSAVGGDPGFFDAVNGDFTLTSGSPAVGLGFNPAAVEQRETSGN